MRHPERIVSIGLPVATMIWGIAKSAAEEPGAPGICADREAMIELLVEAHGAAPNASSAILADNMAPLSCAEAGRAFGNRNDAVAIYDRIIREMTTSLRVQR